MAKIDKPVKGKVYCLDYKQEIGYWSSSTRPVNERVKYYFGDNKSLVITDKMKVYTDEDFIFTVLEDQKKIVLTRNPNEPGDNTSIMEFIKNQEAIIKRCELDECSVDKSKGVRKIVLNAEEVNVKGFEAEKLVYFFDESGNNLKKTITTYSRKYPVRRMSITINKIDFNNTYRFPKDLYSTFLDANGKLKPKYRGYQLITD